MLRDARFVDRDDILSGRWKNDKDGGMELEVEDDKVVFLGDSTRHRPHLEPNYVCAAKIGSRHLKNLGCHMEWTRDDDMIIGIEADADNGDEEDGRESINNRMQHDQSHLDLNCFVQ